ncbi:LOW QUALITY PROTEIN: ras-related and estrogen-regulated growth inhibitor-like protein [Phycodurus eques]|uniref:LOW QUALITY PROTEIN: ras-related and estrogen-regulated growth inhibitor-like protein n=1 Tax=Phycodurus eques TaxID=693459 RepID=UPI002ACE7A81|nr:LOW QUALITY PROTEIN: ras-related and estrogen-regulated growth inhibitor-like protein [Phycodurus eques]
MNEIKIAVLGSEGVGKSALIVQFFTKRFIGEYASSSDPFMWRMQQTRLQTQIPTNDVCAAYQNRMLDAESLIFVVGNKHDLRHMREVRREEGQRLAAEFRCQFHELSAAERHREVALIFSKAVQSAGSKGKERRRRPSGSKSVAKLINNVFGKRRKSV